MALNLNKCLMGGRLVRDPELKQMADGKIICTFTVAINRDYKGKDGNTPSDFFDCVAWGATGENIARFFHKGNPIFVEGSLASRSWTANDGTKRSKTEINVSNFRFVEKSSGEPNNSVSPTPLGSYPIDAKFEEIAPGEDLPF